MGLLQLLSTYILSNVNCLMVQVACAVCDINRDAATYTHFGSETCPRGFNADYVGYVFSNHYSQVSTGEYVCVDTELQVPSLLFSIC